MTQEPQQENDATEHDAQRAPSRSTQAATSSPSRPVVVAVDDDPMMHEALRRLERQPNHAFRYRVVQTCSEALDHTADPDAVAVLADYRLEDGLGTDIIAQVPRLPVIVMTGYGSEQVALEALRAGAYDYLIKDGAGGFLNLVEATIDRALRRRRAEAAVLAREASLTEMKHENRTLERLASLLAKTLVTPLEVSTHYASLLRSHPPLQNDSLAQSYLKALHTGTKRAQVLINDVLLYSQIMVNDAPMAEIDLDALLRGTLAGMRQEIDSSNCRVELTATLPGVCGVADQLRKLFAAILGRGLRRQLGNGATAPPTLRIEVRELPTTWELRVHDGGPPASPRALIAFEQPDQSGPAVAEGSLELAICRRIVERHGGEFWFEIEGPGAPIVAFTLPRTS